MSESAPQPSIERPWLARARAAANASGRKRQRSALTNGRRLLAGVSGNSPWVRRCKDIIAAHMVDLGGADNASAAERSIIRRVAVLTTELERLEVRFALANEASADDLDLYARVSGNLRRLLEAVGIQRRAKNVTPSIAEYLEHIGQAASTMPPEGPGEPAGEVLAPGREDTP